MIKLLTIGYEGASIEDFIATLESAGVETLLDIRDVPISRKPGFSKTRLSDRLQDAGLAYFHLRPLGDPKPGRDAARRGDMQEFRKIFHAHLAGADAQNALARAIAMARVAPTALLCFERDPAHCHRRIVADAMAERETFAVQHLDVHRGLAAQENYHHDGLDRAFAVG